ncbi:hypothetical protein TYRP_023261 [Tyrophagus putrescentiae]|nr:hypothetical protein TYRP_023261 [Tyrophagus putrescentiae]
MAIAHWNVKLCNLLLDRRMNTKLCDFGFAFYGSAKLALDAQFSTDILGTPPCMSPQLLMKVPYNLYKANIFATGVSLFLMFSEEYPLQRTTDQEVILAQQQRDYPQFLRSRFSQTMLAKGGIVATAKTSGPPKLQVLERKTRAKPSKTEHSKGLLTVSSKISPLKSFLSGSDSILLVYGQSGSVFKHQSPRPQILPQQQPKPEEYFSLSSQSNVKVMVSPRKTSPLSPIPPPEQRQNNCSQQQQTTSSATNGHYHYQPPSNNNSSANSIFASSSSSTTTTTSHSEAPTRGHRSRKQTLPQLDVSLPNPQNELPDSDDQEPATDEIPPQPPIASTSSSSSVASAPLPPPLPQNEPMLLPPVNALTCVTFFCRHCQRFPSLPGGQEAVDAHRNAHQGRQTSDANTGISRLPRYLPNAFAVSGVKRANDGAGVAGEIALAVEVGAGVGSGDSGS